MKLSKLYCNDEKFKNIKFNLKGLTVIYADVKSQPIEKKNSHDLGKTKLAELIDFLLIKEIDRKHFLLKTKEQGTSIFDDFIFYLEVQLNSGKYLTIKRSVGQHTKTSFSLSFSSTHNFTPPTIWVHENLGYKKAKEYLNEILAFDFFQGKSYTYRKAVSYSIRKQQDYDDVYKLSKFVGGKDVDWKPFMFDLLGFDGETLEKKYRDEENIKNIAEIIDSLKKDFSVNENSRDEIVAQLAINEGKANKIEKDIDAFNFYEQDKTLIKEGIEDIESKISQLNTTSYNLNYEIEKLQTSIKNNFAFNINKVEKVFKEANMFFPENLKNNYEDLLSFNKELTKERNKYIKEVLIDKKNKLKIISNELYELNKKKEDLLGFLQDTDTFNKFKVYQRNLSKIQGEIISLQERIKVIDTIIQKEKELESFNRDIEKSIEILKELQQNTDKNTRYNDIRSKFSQYFEEVMNEDAYISWSLNTNNNVDFTPPKIKTKDSSSIDTAKDEGKTYRKLLCIMFDLAILTTYNAESYFRFVYHDDVLSQQDNGIKRRLLELIRNLSLQYDFQYILSVIKSDLPTDENDSPILFDENEIILKLNDKDEIGTLFGFEF